MFGAPNNGLDLALSQPTKRVGIVVIITCLSFATFAQQRPPAFDVTVVRPSNSTEGINNRHDPAFASWTNAPLTVVIENGYSIQPDQLIGGPPWIKSDRWDIVGKTDAPATWDQQNKMLQPLLEDRFKLKVHWETRRLPVYELVVPKGGHEIQESSPNGGPDTHPAGTKIGRGLIEGHKMSIAQFVFWLRGEVGRPVVDKTGLTGKYDFKLEWVPDESQPNSRGELLPPGSTGPSIFAAIQDLGLKLKATKGPVEVLVIHHVDKPSEN